MRHIVKERAIKKLILKHGHDLEKFFIGTGDTYSLSENGSRFIFDASKRAAAVKRNAEFAIKYFDTYDFYIVWKCRQPATSNRTVWRSIYSVDANTVLESYHHGVYKHVDVRWGDEEIVLVFSWNELENFIAALHP